jgi:hypothetical protein
MLDDELRELLARAETIAVVGAKDKPGQPVDRVGRYLMEAGYRVIPVHPVRKTVWGLQAYPTVHDVPEPIHIVDVFRAPQYCPDHARECAALDPAPLLFWLQSGIHSEEAAQILEPTPVRVVMNACLMVEHKRLTA